MRANHRDRFAVAGAPHFRHGNSALAGQVLTGQRLLVLEQLLVGARVHDPAAVLPRSRTDVDDVVGDLHGVFVVLHHHHGVAEIAHADERLDQPLVVSLVQTDRRFVQHVQHAHQT